MLAALMVAACASPPEPRAPFTLDALLADASAYVASRYGADEMPTALNRRSDGGRVPVPTQRHGQRV